MTNPVDDAGNPRVDFVWGNFPLQPDDQRDDAFEGNDVANQDQNKQWYTRGVYSSHTLDTGWTEITFGTGDGGNSRTQTFTWDNHEIAVDNYENYPGFTGGYPYDDTVPNLVVPNLIGLTIEQADTALSALGLSSDSHTTTVGATSGNDGKIASQVPAAGTVVNAQDVVLFTLYHYVAITTGPIAGFNRTAAGTSFSLNGDQSIMYVSGTTVKPTVGDTISVTGSDDAEHNVSWTVTAVENNDSYNTGGTAVKVTLVTGTITSSTATGGTWTKI